MSHRWVIDPAALILGAVLWAGGIGLAPALAGEADSAVRADSVVVASLADEADLSRSTDGELFEDNSHSLHDELSGAEGDHGLESEHEGLESDHGGESEHGGGSEPGGGDSGGEGGD